MWVASQIASEAEVLIYNCRSFTFSPEKEMQTALCSLGPQRRRRVTYQLTMKEPTLAIFKRKKKKNLQREYSETLCVYTTGPQPPQLTCWLINIQRRHCVLLSSDLSNTARQPKSAPPESKLCSVAFNILSLSS